MLPVNAVAEQGEIIQLRATFMQNLAYRVGQLAGLIARPFIRQPEEAVELLAPKVESPPPSPKAVPAPPPKRVVIVEPTFPKIDLALTRRAAQLEKLERLFAEKSPAFHKELGSFEKKLKELVLEGAVLPPGSELSGKLKALQERFLQLIGEYKKNPIPLPTAEEVALSDALAEFKQLKQRRRELDHRLPDVKPEEIDQLEKEYRTCFAKLRSMNQPQDEEREYRYLCGARIRLRGRGEDVRFGSLESELVLLNFKFDQLHLTRIAAAPFLTHPQNELLRIFLGRLMRIEFNVLSKVVIQLHLILSVAAQNISFRDQLFRILHDQSEFNDQQFVTTIVGTLKRLTLLAKDPLGIIGGIKPSQTERFDAIIRSSIGDRTYDSLINESVVNRNLDKKLKSQETKEERIALLEEQKVYYPEYRALFERKIKELHHSIKANRELRKHVGVIRI